MEIVGYCIINKDATTGIGSNDLEVFKGNICSVMEFDSKGGALVLRVDNDKGGLCMFDKCDIVKSFKCSEEGGVIMEPKLNLLERTMYHSKVMNRKGSYNSILKRMVIAASLHYGKFNDNVLWAKQ